MNAPKVTLKLLSERTGFDKSTISRVLRGDTTLSIRPENLELIQRTARELNYVPDLAGRSLRSSRTYSLGAVIPSLQNQIHAQIIEGAHEICYSKGYSLILVQADTADRQVEAVKRLVAGNRIEGLLALTFRNEYAQAATLGKLGVPVMAVNWKADGLANWITVDERLGGRLAAEHLISLGHRRIAHISGDLERFNAHERYLGFCEGLEAGGIKLDPDLISRGGYSFEEGFAAMNALLDRRRGDFTAVFGVSLLTSAGAINAMQKRGVRIPDDVSIVSFHDGLVAEVMTPRLTTVAFALNDMGRFAASGLIRILEGQSEAFSQIVPGARLIVRESTRALT